LETNRIYHAAAGWLIVFFLPAFLGLTGNVSAQSETTETISPGDSTRLTPPPIGDSSFIMPDTIYAPTSSSDTLAPEVFGDTSKLSLYEKRAYISQGPEDEIKGIPEYYLETPGPVGSQAIAVKYLNTPGLELKINNLPFPYNGLYRPYLIGTDLNAIPWEILNDIQPIPLPPSGDGLNFGIGVPHDKVNRSDVEVAQGPFNYRSSRWRFFRPFGKKTYAYFAVDFKKSNGFIENSDYNGNHAIAGISHTIGNGELSFNFWRHRAKTGLNSFDFLTPQLTRQSRGIDRGELHYQTRLKFPLYLNITGLAHRTAQTVSGDSSPIKVNDNLGGIAVDLADSLNMKTITGGLSFFRLQLTGAPIPHRAISMFSTSIKATVQMNRYGYFADLDLTWNSVDGTILSPAIGISYAPKKHIRPYISFSRARRIPDLHLLYVDDSVTGIGVPSVLNNYHFKSNSSLSFPVTSNSSIGIEVEYDKWQASINASYNYVRSQIYLSVADTTVGDFNITPINFSDKYFEFSTDIKGRSGSFSGEAWGAYRKWPQRYFSDGLEKGPAAVGFGRISVLRQFFIPRLLLGASFEVRASSRRDYRGLTPGLTDSYFEADSRFEFHYKDFTFYIVDQNLANEAYITYWPYYNTPRVVWWGIRWVFFD
jgi:hypothetical protein